jgi:hypothetical protein
MNHPIETALRIASSLTTDKELLDQVLNKQTYEPCLPCPTLDIEMRLSILIVMA